MAPTREMSLETKERIVKLLEEGNPSRMVAKDVGCSQSAVSKIWTKYKQHGMVVKAKRTGRPRKTSKRQDKQLKAICLENRKSTTKQMKHKWEEVGVNVCDRTVRNRLKEMGFQYRKAKRKPALTPKHKRTRLQWAKERQSWTLVTTPSCSPRMAAICAPSALGRLGSGCWTAEERKKHQKKKKGEVTASYDLDLLMTCANLRLFSAKKTLW
uniref:Transposase Tc1-like domain-containing protein n=1 Tax=Xiphophorus maculatus TaxID=8083 RepID=A0A3B5PX39_XIPMA